MEKIKRSGTTVAKYMDGKKEYSAKREGSMCSRRNAIERKDLDSPFFTCHESWNDPASKCTLSCNLYNMPP
jgi:hypothetical protein